MAESVIIGCGYLGFKLNLRTNKLEKSSKFIRKYLSKSIASIDQLISIHHNKKYEQFSIIFLSMNAGDHSKVNSVL